MTDDGRIVTNTHLRNRRIDRELRERTEAEVRAIQAEGHDRRDAEIISFHRWQYRLEVAAIHRAEDRRIAAERLEG